MLKWLLGFLKTPVANLVAELQANRAANIAAIEATVGGGGTTVEAAVTGFLANEAKKNAELAVLVPLVEPALISEITTLVGQGTNTIPELYDAGVAWLTHEESEL